MGGGYLARLKRERSNRGVGCERRFGLPVDEKARSGRSPMLRFEPLGPIKMDF